MQYIEKNGNVERVYNVFCNEEELSWLLNKIVENVNYEEDGTFTLSYNARVDYDKNKIISGEYLPNGKPEYKNIKKIYPFTSNGPCSYHNDSIAVEGTRIVVPYLAYLIKRILSNGINSIGCFIDYKNSGDFISIDERIELLNDKIRKMDNSNIDKKINLLEELKKLLYSKKNGTYFDAELIREYYDLACSHITLQLVSEKTIMNNNDKILLKNFK